jgi:hypothetical protein
LSGSRSSPARAAAASSHASAIVNGSTNEGDPALVYLDLGSGSCSGTVVSPHIVFTARHCLNGVAQGRPRVFFGTSRTGPGTWIDSVEHATSPDADLGMVVLADPSPAAPVPMYRGDLSAHLGEAVRIAGFGVTGEARTGGGLKRVGTTKLDSLSGGIMYTGADPDGSWTCYGDSGGPNYMTIDGTEVVVGVTSFGTTTCGMPYDGAVRTDTYATWLDAYVAEREDLEPPTLAVRSPADGAEVTPGFVVEVETADPRGIRGVQLRIGDEFGDSDQGSPYQLIAPPLTALGPRTLTVVAKDRLGNATTKTLNVTIVAECTSAEKCTAGEVCAGGACVGDLGSPCDRGGDCESGQCDLDVMGVRACTRSCASADECPSGFTCLSASMNAPTKCWPGGDGGCAIAPGGGGAGGAGSRGPGGLGPLLALVLGAGAARLNRRRRE